MEHRSHLLHLVSPRDLEDERRKLLKCEDYIKSGTVNVILKVKRSVMNI